MTNYAELQQAVIEDTHRPDLAGLVPRFISEGEGMIRREMIADLISTTLTETDRSPDNIAQYILPVGSLIIRKVAVRGAVKPEVTRIALGSITTYASQHRVAVYVESGSGNIEFRGNPPEDTIFDLDYFGMPAPLVQPDDTNDLLDANLTLYKAAAMFYLYQNTQDRELASDSLAVFSGVVETLNEQIARKIGGAKVTASYHFGHRGGY